MNVRRSLTALVVFSSILFSCYLISQTSHAQTVVTTNSGKFYKLEILATNGMSGITTIDSSSINDFGTVAFNTTGGGGGLFTANGRTPLLNIIGPDVNAPQINNYNHVVYRTNPPGQQAGSGTLLRRNTNLANFPLTEIAGENGTAHPDFGNINLWPSINNNPTNPSNPQVAFSGFIPDPNAQTQVVTGIRPALNRQAVVPGNVVETFPVVADNGAVVLRTGLDANPALQIIRLYQNYNLTGTPVTIAAGSNWNGLGKRPGISDDGSVVVFYGNLTSSGATNLQTTQGPGIFANYEEGVGVRRTVRIARRQVENILRPAGNRDGVCDAPEQTATPTGTPPQAQCV